MPQPRDIVELGGYRRVTPEPAGSLRGRPWIAIRWTCCSAYSRAYRNAAGTAYQARCPRCMRAVTVRVGQGGTDCRFFVAR